MNAFGRLSAAALILLCATPAFAIPWLELGDAGQTIATAQTTLGSGSLTSISGSQTFAGDVDLYKILVTDAANFSAEVTSMTGAAPDSQLFLFDSTGLFLAEDDDGGTGLLSLLPTGTLGAGAEGLYYLGISDFDNDPMEAIGQILTDFDNNYIAANIGDYEIQLTGAGFAPAVPAPMTIGLLSLGILGLGYQRRKFHNAA